jgi:hypothetical protein
MCMAATSRFSATGSATLPFRLCLFPYADVTLIIRGVQMPPITELQERKGDLSDPCERAAKPSAAILDQRLCSCYPKPVRAQAFVVTSEEVHLAMPGHVNVHLDQWRPTCLRNREYNAWIKCRFIQTSPRPRMYSPDALARRPLPQTHGDVDE